VKRFLLFTNFLLCAWATTAQLARSLGSIIYPSLVTYSSQFNDAFSFRSNSAALAGITQFSAGIFSERRFLLEDLQAYSLAVALPTSSGNFGVKADRSGGKLLSETTLGLAYGRKLGEKVAVGVQFDYYSLQAEGYGAASAVTFEAGTIIHLTDAVQTGISVYNPLRMKVGKSGEEKLPAVYSIGLGYDVSPQFFLGAEAQKTEDQPLTMNLGMHYVFADKLIARGGISSATSVYFIGFGVQLKHVRVDATASIHPYLGTTPGLLLIYAPQK
jgi:hypothetical protein